MNLLLELLAVAALILLNAFFVAAEYGLVTSRRTRIEELGQEGNRRGRRVLGLVSDPPRFIAAMQLGVTLTSLGIGALGEHALTRAFDPVMATALAVVIAYLLLTFFHVVIGELVPKGIALGHSERTALALAAPVRAFFALAWPLIWVLQRTTNAVLGLLGLEPPGGETEVHSEAELKMLLNVSTERGGIEGIVTLEDLLEEIVGEIEDEFDLPDESVEQVDEDTIRIDGTFPIDDFNEQFRTELPVEDYHTLAGFVFGQLGRAPEKGDEISHDGLVFRVEEVEGQRIDKLAVTFERRREEREADEAATAEPGE